VITWDMVCAYLESLPEAQRDPPGGREVVRVRGKVVAYPAANDRSRPPGAAADEPYLVIRTDPQTRAALLQEAPDTFFVTPHYQHYPGVIVRLATITPERLQALLTAAWRQVAPVRVVRDFDAGAG
jgi:hypothetical protein